MELFNFYVFSCNLLNNFSLGSIVKSAFIVIQKWSVQKTLPENSIMAFQRPGSLWSPLVTQRGDLHYHVQLQPPSEDADWTTPTPTFMGTESPKVGRAVNRINEEHANSPPQTISEVCDLVQDLHARPPTSPVEDPVIQVDSEQPATTTQPTPTLFMETVAETVRPPLLLARRTTATPA